MGKSSIFRSFVVLIALQVFSFVHVDAAKRNVSKIYREFHLWFYQNSHLIYASAHKMSAESLKSCEIFTLI